MKYRISVLLLLCALVFLIPVSSVAENRTYTYRLGNMPQMQITLDSAWRPIKQGFEQYSYMDFEPISVFKHRDKIHEIHVYFIPYNAPFTPPAALDFVQKQLSARGEQVHPLIMNGTTCLEGIMSNSKGFGLILQDSLQYGYYAVIGYPQKGAKLSEQDIELVSVIHSVCNAGSLETDQAVNNSSLQPEKESGESASNLLEKKQKLEEEYQSFLAMISKEEEALAELLASADTLKAEIQTVETDLRVTLSAADDVEPELKKAQAELDEISSLLRCANCGYDFSDNNDFKFCPECGSARTIPQEHEENLNKEYLSEIQENVNKLTARYNGLVSLKDKKQSELNELKEKLQNLEAKMKDAQDRLADAKAEASKKEEEILLLQNEIQELSAQGKCLNCGYIFPQDSTFKFCPVCGTSR